LINWVKRFNKHAGDVLAADEQYLGGVLLQRSGTTRSRIAGGITLGVVGAVVATKASGSFDLALIFFSAGTVGAVVAMKMSNKGEKAFAEATSGLTAADFTVPASGFGAAVTNQRVMFFRLSMGGRPEEPVRSSPVSEVKVQTIDRTAMRRIKNRAYIFHFANGTSLTAETPSMGPAGKLADAYEAALEQAGVQVERLQA